MNKKKEENKAPRGYSLLWIIVMVISFLIIISFFINLIGLGRWDCAEYSEIECNIECYNSNILKENLQIYQGECKSEYLEGCLKVIEITQTKSKCIKEVWTRRKNV